jgi:hypothetical protein
MIEHEIARLPRGVAHDDGKGPVNDLAARWADLVEQLALGPELDMRECPVCRHHGMRAATRCGYCWKELTPLTDRAAAK